MADAIRLPMFGQARVICSTRRISIAPRPGFVHCQPHFLGDLHRQVNPSQRCKIPFPGAIRAHKNHDANGDDHHHSCEHHHQHGGHSHTHLDLHDEQGLNALQLGIVRLAKLTGLAYIADAWRDNLQLCCASIGLLLSGLVCPKLLPPSRGLSLQTTLAVAAFSLIGVPAVLDAAVDVGGGKVNMHVLMALAAFASVFMGNAMEGALLLAMFSLSHQAEEYFTNKAMGDVKALRKSNPEFALVLQESDVLSHPNFAAVPVKQVDVAKVEVGSFLLVKAGEGVPVDAEVCQGRSTVTLEHLTGEAHPLEKKVGDSVPGGARNLDGMLVVKATKTWKESTLAKIMTLTEEAQANKPKLQRWLDDFGEKYSKAVVAVSAMVALLGPAVFKWPFFSNAGVRGSLYRALGLMVAASPCALAVAPLAYATAISSCASKGILLKGGEVFDALARCDTIAFDKTGTLTTGELECKAIEPIHGHSPSSESAADGDSSCCHPTCEAEALAVAAALERGATHPIARAVVQHSEGRELPTILVDNFESRPGQGLFGTVTNQESGDHKALIGSLDYIASASSVPGSQQIRAAAEHSIYGNDLVHAALAVDNKVTLFHFEDKIRKGAADVLKSLKDEASLRLLMLTGDHSPSAQRVADAVGIQEVHSGLKPEDKLLQVRRLSQEAGGLIMVGDGINDAPALAAATVGIVLAQFASATAVAVADVLLLNDRIEGVPFIISKSRQTMSLVKQNVALALCSIFVAAMSSVGGLLPLWITVLLSCLSLFRASFGLTSFGTGPSTRRWNSPCLHQLGPGSQRSNVDITMEKRCAELGVQVFAILEGSKPQGCPCFVDRLSGLLLKYLDYPASVRSWMHQHRELMIELRMYFSGQRSSLR